MPTVEAYIPPNISTGPDPLRSLKLIDNFKLYDQIFSVFPSKAKESLSGSREATDTALAAASILHTLLKGDDRTLPDLHPNLFNALAEDPTCKSRLFLAAALRPFSEMTFVDEKDRTQPVVWLSLWESLRLGTQSHFLDGIPPLYAAAKLLSKPDVSSERLQKPSKRVAIGAIIFYIVRIH